MLIRLIASLLLSVALYLGQGKGPQAPASNAPLPRTVEEAVSVLKIQWLSEKDRDWILRNPRDLVTATLHLPFGTGVRNSFKLWGGNSELLASCGVDHPEECSGIIFARLWDSVRADADPVLVRKLDCQFRLIETIPIDYKGFYALRMGEMLERVQQQIDAQMLLAKSVLSPGCEPSLLLKPTGNPNLKCYVRAEFSEDGRRPSLGLFLGWISFRNGFDAVHSPREVELRFHEKCAWPERPRHFRPKIVQKP